MYTTRFFFFILIILAAASCSQKNTAGNETDYSTLPNLDVDMVLEIGESEYFIPSRLRELIVKPGGTMLVSDWGRVTIDQFSADGEHMGTIAEEGGGPGKLSNFFRMFHARSDSLLVQFQGARKDLFAPDSRGLYKQARSITEESSAQHITFIGRHGNSEYFASLNQVVRDVQRAISDWEPYRQTKVNIIDLNGKTVADSLHSLKTPSPFIRMVNGGISVHTIPYRISDRLLPLKDGRYLVARPDSSSFILYNKDHAIEKVIPFSVSPREITAADLDFAFRNISREIRRQLEQYVSSLKPSYLDVFATENHIWLHTDTREEGSEIVVLNYDGVPLGRFMISANDEINHTDGDRLYTIHKDPETGDTIRVYQVQI